MAGPEERGGRGAGGSGEAQTQGQPRDSAMAPVQPSLGPPRDEPRVFGLDKFNGDNFAEWSFKIENIFDHYDLLEVMEGTEKRPENDPEKSPWVRKSAQGYLLLGQALGSSQIRHIKPFQREPEKGPKAWAALKGLHAPATAAVAVVLERQMVALRIEEDEAVEEGVQKFFDLLTRLEGADLNYSELQKKNRLLALLPESWSLLIINLNRDLPHLSLEDVKRAILQEDFRRRAEDEGGEDLAATTSVEAAGVVDTAATTRATDAVVADSTASQEGRGAGGGRGRGRGGRDGRGGGAASMKSAGNESESRDDRFPGQFFFVSTQASAGPEKDEVFEEQAAVGKVTLHSLDYWVIDSGATYSMTPRADLLIELEPSPVKHVTSALGQRAEVKGMGKAMIKGADGKMVGLKNVLWVPNLAANLISVRRLQKAGMDTSSKGAKTYTARLGERILWDLHEDRDVYNEMWQIPLVPMPKERQVAASISTKGEAVGSGDGANSRAKEINSKQALTHVGADKWVPYVEWIGRKPKVDMLRVFGCMCMALVPKHLRHNKLGAKAIWAVHLGMAQNSKGWLLWDPFTNKFLVSRDCKFMENLMYKDWKAENEAKIGMRFGEVKSSDLEHVELPVELRSSSTTTRQSSLVNGGEEAKDAEEEEEEVQQVSERAPTLPSRTMIGDDKESDYDECAFVFFSPVEMPGEPATLKEALESIDAEEWKKAMESELKSTEENGTWELVELPEGRKAITSKWLFKIKSDADGKIERYKSRLVAKGYQQKEKVDYKELFALVVKLTTLRTLLAGAAIKGWVVKQMDVTTTFLNGVLEEEIFMAQPEGFDDGSGRIGFTPSTADHSLFMLGEGEQRSFMVVYVDDILIFSPSSDLVKEVMLKLQDKFKCKALGDVSFYLGLHIERDVEKRCMRVHQRKYLEALAANFGQSEGHVATPFPSGFKCVKGPEEESVGEEERRRFHSLVGSLMYAAVNTRPDVAFATGQLARVVQCPNEEQVAAGMRVAKYLGQTPTVGLQYSAAAQRRQKGADGVEPGRLFLTAFSDASFASEPEDMTSVGGFICCVGGGPTAWESKK
ncbi:unnamed protein product [Closterium sp. NIES-53]